MWLPAGVGLIEPSLPALPSALHQTLLPSSSQEKSGAHTLLNLTSRCLGFLSLLICIDVRSLSLQGDEELAIDVMDRLSPSILESFIHLTGADQVTGGVSSPSYLGT